VKRQEAPGPLELVRKFINTHDLEQDTDALATTGQAHAWLADQHLIQACDQVQESARQRAVEIREALRSLARANSGTHPDPDTIRALDRLARDAAVQLRFRADGTQDLAPDQGTGTLAALGRLLATVGLAAFDGTWRRLKICPAPDCLWAFYDHSKNRSGTWCQMAECGNRAKIRSYRTRTAARTDTNPQDTRR
jgi:predicted RNA-binding Zn ribbon-like protein